MPNVRPMIIAIWCGDGKPNSLNEYLTPFVQELNKLIETGIIVNAYKIRISIRCFKCDSPARAFIKGMTLYMHFLVYMQT